MKERPILFSAPMVRAILDGSKTQTRRACEPMNKWVEQDCREVRTMEGEPFHFLKGATVPLEKLRCPHGQPSDRLWVRETFAIESAIDGNDPPFNDGRPVFRPPDTEFSPAWFQPHYKATDPAPELCCENNNCRDCESEGYGPHWKPSIHMPRWASRILLEVVSVRVERLQDISRGDAMAEGCPFPNMAGGPDPRDWLRDLWESINGAGSWDANPWVWCIEFKVVKP